MKTSRSLDYLSFIGADMSGANMKSSRCKQEPRWLNWKMADGNVTPILFTRAKLW